ncbi:MAG: BppU family phage baseplate upper protein [Eubacterium limosum]|nr:BppU family phage baseplate upper protein [Eubacterium limosum]
MSIEKVRKALTLDVTAPSGFESVLYMGQYDNQTREVEINLVRDGSPYTIPSDGTVSAKIFCDKPDGRNVFNTATISGNKIIVVFTDQMLAATGAMPCRVALFGTSGERLTTADFVVMVRENRADGGALSSDEFNALTEALASIDEAKKKADEAATAVDGYEKRIQKLVDESTSATTAATNAAQSANEVKTATEKVKDDTLKAKTDAETATAAAVQATKDTNEAATKAVKAATNAETAATRANDASERVEANFEKVDQASDQAEAALKQFENIEEEIQNAVTISTEKANEATQSKQSAEEAAQRAAQEAAKVKTWKPNVTTEGDLSWQATPDETPPETVNIIGPPGQKGEQGVPGVVTQLDPGLFGMYVDEAGHLILAHNDNEAAPPIRIENGHLIYEVI